MKLSETSHSFLHASTHLVGRREREVEEVGQGLAGDVEHGLHAARHGIPRLHGVGRHPQLLLRAQDAVGD